MTEPSALATPNCWAEGLGECGGGLSREHPVSKGLLGTKPIQVSGYHWCPEPKTISPEALASKNLCRHHNSALSEIDEKGTAAMVELEKVLQVRGVRRIQGKGKLRQRAKLHYYVDGLFLERWMLKAMIGIGVSHQAGAQWKPPFEWVQIVFGKRSFSPGTGLYISDPVSEQLELEKNKFSLLFLSDEGHEISAAEFGLNGWKMILSLVPLEPAPFSYRPPSVCDRDGVTIWQVIRFGWPTV